MINLVKGLLKKELMSCEDNVYYTEISNYKNIKLSELVNV